MHASTSHAHVFNTMLACNPGHAWADGKEKVAEFAASGFLIKDTVEVTALDDPEGVQQHHSVGRPACVSGVCPAI